MQLSDHEKSAIQAYEQQQQPIVKVHREVRPNKPATGPNLNKLQDFDKKMQDRYANRICQLKLSLDRLAPLYLNFSDPPPDKIEFDNPHKFQFRIEDYKKERSVTRLTDNKKNSLHHHQKSEPKLVQNDYNKWYIKPHQRFIKKEETHQQIPPQKYLQKIIDGKLPEPGRVNPFQGSKNSSTLDTQNKQQEDKQVNKRILLSIAKELQKKDKRVPVFFLPYINQKQTHNNSLNHGESKKGVRI